MSAISETSVNRMRIQDEILYGKGNRPEAKGAERTPGQQSRASDDASESEITHRGRGKGLEHAPGQRRRIQDEILNPKPPVSPAPPEVEEPKTEETKETTSISTEPSNDIRSLATRYVDQFLKLSDKSLSQEDRKSLIEDVERFYSAPSRSGRLEKIVFEQSEAA